MVNWSDPYERAAFLNENERKRAEGERDLAERQERRMAGLDREWHVPEPETTKAVQRPSKARKGTMLKWAAHTRSFASAAVEASERRIKARQDRQLERLADAMGRVLAEERTRYREELDALRAEIAQLKASDEHVIDMRGLFGSKRDAA